MLFAPTEAPWSLATWTGWVATALLVAAAAVPLANRLLAGRRAPPDSRRTGVHVLLGFGTTAAALAHAMAVLPSLGSPGAVAGGMLALGPAAFAFFLLAAHVGVGLQLRSPQLRERVRKRRQHVLIAIGIATMVAVHVIAVRVAGSREHAAETLTDRP
jgi:predicted membrane-bound spermidine synthase